MKGGRGKGKGRKGGKGKEKEVMKSVTPEPQAMEALREAQQKIACLEKQVWALIRHLKIQWDSRNQGIAPDNNRAPRRTTPPANVWKPSPANPPTPHPFIKEPAIGANATKLAAPATPARPYTPYPGPAKKYGRSHVGQEMKGWDEKEKARIKEEEGKRAEEIKERKSREENREEARDKETKRVVVIEVPDSQPGSTDEEIPEPSSEMLKEMVVLAGVAEEQIQEVVKRGTKIMVTVKEGEGTNVVEAVRKTGTHKVATMERWAGIV